MNLERLFEDGLTALRKQRYNEAHDCFSEAMDLEPEMPEIHYNLGLAASHLYRWKEAENCFRMAVRTRPTPAPDDLVHLGLVRLHLRRWDDAADDFEAALKLDPASELARAHLDDLRFFLGRPDRSGDAHPFLCAGWYEPRLDDFVGVDPEIVPKAERGGLREYLKRAFEDGDCDHTHELAEQWALETGRDPLGVSRFLYERGMRCDCEVLAEGRSRFP